MKTNDITIEALQAYRDQLTSRLQSIDEELSRLLGDNNVVHMPKRSGTGGKRVMSAEAKKKLSAAMKKRWAERKAASA
jgi:hypothetical protein